MNWWEQGFLCVDTETDGVDPEEARVASICRAVVNPSDRSTDVRTAYCAIEMPEAAGKVNGLSTEFLMHDGKPLSARRRRIASMGTNSARRTPTTRRMAAERAARVARHLHVDPRRAATPSHKGRWPHD